MAVRAYGAPATDESPLGIQAPCELASLGPTAENAAIFSPDFFRRSDWAQTSEDERQILFLFARQQRYRPPADSLFFAREMKEQLAYAQAFIAMARSSRDPRWRAILTQLRHDISQVPPTATEKILIQEIDQARLHLHRFAPPAITESGTKKFALRDRQEFLAYVALKANSPAYRNRAIAHLRWSDLRPSLRRRLIKRASKILVKFSENSDLASFETLKRYTALAKMSTDARWKDFLHRIEKLPPSDPGELRESLVARARGTLAHINTVTEEGISAILRWSEYDLNNRRKKLLDYDWPSLNESQQQRLLAHAIALNQHDEKHKRALRVFIEFARYSRDTRWKQLLLIWRRSLKAFDHEWQKRLARRIDEAVQSIDDEIADPPDPRGRQYFLGSFASYEQLRLQVQRAMREGRISFSEHAFDRMGERVLSEGDVTRALLHPLGAIVHSEGYDPVRDNYTFRWQMGRIHVVLGSPKVGSKDKFIIVTTYMKPETVSP